MKRFLLGLLLVSSAAFADTTGNLITNTWNNVTNGTHPNDCCTGGPGPLYDASTNTIHFSYGLTAVHQVIGINTALQGTGIQVNGWNWGYDLRNMNGVAGGQSGTDTISVTSFITNSAGQIVQQSDQYYSTQFDWTRFSGTVNLDTNLGIADAGSLGIQFVSRDSGYWAGYYGPQVRDVSLTANYTVDQCTVNPQSSPTCPGFKTYYNMWDDGYAQVNLPFAFPFYGQLFTTSYMYTNGVVGFLNNNWGFCCDGTDLNYQTSQPNSPWNYAIYALNTDLIPGPNSEFYTQVTDGGTGLKYSWVNVPEIGTTLNNTFHVQIKDSGYIGITYDQVNLNSWRNPLIGIAGDISKGEYVQTYYGQASGLPNLVGTTNVYTGTELTDICSINPLFNTSCPGYATAYFNQQCTINSLYDPQCPGYATAYYNYQCTANPLYHTGCPGYQQAYFDQQCSLDPLYNNQCPGYDTAYFDQQCSLDGLYNQSCPNYADAFYVQQCTLNPLYDTGCTGYETAYFDQQCSLNSLYSNQCPGYQQAYFDQQCSLNGLYDRTCPNYADAYAKQQLLNPPATTPETVVVAVVEESKPALVSDPVVNDVITTTATSASPAQAATATVPLAPAPAPATTTVAAVESAPAEKKEEKSNDTSTDTSSTTTTASASSSSEKKDEPKTTRQALAQKRLEAARAKAVEQGKNLANEVGKAATMEAQVAVQAVVLSAMSFVPGFDAYGRVTVPDALGYKPFTVYNNQKNVDNARLVRGLTGASDALHEQIVASQYTRN